MKVNIIGCGGVGSNLAYFLSRNPDVDELVLVDNDIVESKNLSRQFFTKEDIGRPKVDALGDLIQKFNPDIRVSKLNMKVDETTVYGIDNSALTILATDGIRSKKILAERCKNIYIANCDKGEFEVKPELDHRDLCAWEIANGYNTSEQDFLSNMLASAEIYKQICLKMKKVVKYHIDSEKQRGV